MTQAMDSAGVAKTSAHADKAIDTSKKTTGERYYDVLQFAVGKVWIMAFTAAIAYLTVYGKEKYGEVPNVFKKFQGWFKNKLLHNSVYPLAEKGEFAERFAGAAANTMVIFHGGNLFAPVMKWMENSKEKIATHFNARYGKEGEIEAGHERLKDIPKQSWGDVLKGRVAAWGIVFASFIGFDTLLGQSKSIKGADGKFMYKFNVYEEKFSRLLAGLTASGREIAKTPMGTALTEAQQQNKLYRLGNIVALDVYATSAAIFIWNFISRMSAKKRKDAAKKPEEVSEIAVASGLRIPEGLFEHDHAQTPQKGHFRMHAPKESASHAAAIEAQRQSQDVPLTQGL